MGIKWVVKKVYDTVTSKSISLSHCIYLKNPNGILPTSYKVENILLLSHLISLIPRNFGIL
jgi:hypothetical protein